MQTENALIRTTNRMAGPVLIPASFVTNGGSNPTTFDGHVESVEVKATADPFPFFRVRFVEAIPNLTSMLTTIVPGLRGAAGDSLTLNISATGFTANPADPIELGRELDVMLMLAGTPINTAGKRVDLHIYLDENEG